MEVTGADLVGLNDRKLLTWWKIKNQKDRETILAYVGEKRDALTQEIAIDEGGRE